MNYYIPVSGKSSGLDNPGGSWSGYWASMPHFESYDCFGFSSADFKNPLYEQFEAVADMQIDQFKDQVLAQQMADVSYTMGCWSEATVRRYIPTNKLYLFHGFSGGCYLFKLHQA